MPLFAQGQWSPLFGVLPGPGREGTTRVTQFLQFPCGLHLFWGIAFSQIERHMRKFSVQYQLCALGEFLSPHNSTGGGELRLEKNGLDKIGGNPKSFFFDGFDPGTLKVSFNFRYIKIPIFWGVCPDILTGFPLSSINAIIFIMLLFFDSFQFFQRFLSKSPQKILSLL